MLMLKLQILGHLMRRTDSLEKTLILGKIEGRRWGRQRMRWLDDITDSMDRKEFEQALGVGDGKGSLVCFSPWSLFSFFLSYGQYAGLSTLHLLPCPEFGKLCTSLPQVVLRSKHYIFPIILSGLVSQSCPTLCDPMDGSLAGSSVHGIFQARISEWGAIAFSTFPLGFVQIDI